VAAPAHEPPPSPAPEPAAHSWAQPHSPMPSSDGGDDHHS
jgi:hypothetical protein